MFVVVRAGSLSTQYLSLLNVVITTGALNKVFQKNVYKGMDKLFYF